MVLTCTTLYPVLIWRLTCIFSPPHPSPSSPPFPPPHHSLLPTIPSSPPSSFQMTPDELKFALRVETVLNSLPDPEFRQMVVEVLMVIGLVGKCSEISSLGDSIVVEHIIGHAHSLFLQDQVWCVCVGGCEVCVWVVCEVCVGGCVRYVCGWCVRYV